jgi:hypothetical protein
VPDIRSSDTMPTRATPRTNSEPAFDFALLHRLGGLFTHRYCMRVLALCAAQPHARQALRVFGRASNAGLDGAIKELRALGLITKVIGDDDNPVFDITEAGRRAVQVLNALSTDLHDVWPDAARRS